MEVNLSLRTPWGYIAVGSIAPLIVILGTRCRWVASLTPDGFGAQSLEAPE